MSSSSVTPPPSTPLPAAAAPAGATPVVTLPQAPAELILLPRGTPVEAKVVAAPEGGQPAQVQIVVDGEPVTVPARLPLPLPVGASLSLKVMPSPAGEALNLRLAAVDGSPPALAAELSGRAAPAPLAAATALQPASTIGVGRPIGATVLRGDVIPDQPGGAEPLAPGTRLTLRLTQVALPEPGGRAVPSQGAAPAAAGAPPAPPQAAAAYAAISRIAQPPGAALAPGQPSPVAPAATPAAPSAPPHAAPAAPGVPQAPSPFAPPPAPPHAPPPQQARADAPPPAPPQPGAPAAPALGTLSGLVIGRSALGQPTLKTDSGFVALDLRAPLPVGTRVAAEVLAQTPPAAGAPPPAAFAGASPVTTLDALVRGLAAVDPEAAARVAAQLPQPGPQLVANLAAAMVAVRGGDVERWLRLGELPSRSRDEARTGKLAQRLAEDLREAAPAAQRPSSEWRVYPLPMLADGQVERIRMLVRRAPGADDEAPERGRRRGDDTRFLLDFTLSHLGPMQIDGLVSRAARNLDLVVRTHAELPEPMPRELQGIFATAMTGIGYAGTLSFRIAAEFVVPEAVRPGDDRAGMVV